MSHADSRTNKVAEVSTERPTEQNFLSTHFMERIYARGPHSTLRARKGFQGGTLSPGAACRMRSCALISARLSFLGVAGMHAVAGRSWLLRAARVHSD